MLTGYKTILVNVLTLIAAIFGGEDITKYVPAEHLLIVVTLANILLRFITKTPVGQSQ